MQARTIVRWGVRILAGALGLVLATAAAVYGFSEARMSRRYVVPDHPISLRGDAAEFANGKRLATIRGCVDCHGTTFAGSVMIDDPAIGRIAAPNLTNGGRGAELEPRDWELAVRHGVRRDGSALRVMPSEEFSEIADDEIAAIASYVRSLPSQTPVQPTARAGPVIRALFLAGQVKLIGAEEIDHSKAHAAHVDAEPTPKYGAYLATGCTGCHGPTLSGGKIPGAPPEWRPAANITPAGIGRYSEAQFMRVIREGKRPDGSTLDSVMPWRLFQSMTDVEAKALYAYLRTVKAKEYGGR